MTADYNELVSAAERALRVLEDRVYPVPNNPANCVHWWTSPRSALHRFIAESLQESGAWVTDEAVRRRLLKTE